MLVLHSKSALAAGGVCWDCGESFLFLSRADGCLGFMAGTGQAIAVSDVMFVPGHCSWGTAPGQPQVLPQQRCLRCCRDVTCHLCLWPSFDFWVKLYQSVLSMNSDSLGQDGAIEPLFIIQQLLKVQGTLFVSR